MAKRSKKKSDKSPFELPAPYVLSIGTVAVAFSILEMYLVGRIEQLAGVTHSVGAAITAHMPTPLRLSVFRSLAELKFRSDPALVYEAGKIADAYRAVAAERADIVHAVWSWDNESDAVLRSMTTARERLRFSLDHKSVDEIELVIGRITDVVVRLTRFSTVISKPKRLAGFTRQQVTDHIARVRSEIDSQYAAYLNARAASSGGKRKSKRSVS